MEIYQLKSFLEIAKVQNLTRAAENLHISQSALSSQIKMLEEEFGVSLGPVEAKRLQIGEALSREYAKSVEELHTKSAAKHARPPTSIRKLLLRLEMAVVWVPAYVVPLHHESGIPKTDVEPVYCSNCGAKNLPNNNFCPECGTKL